MTADVMKWARVLAAVGLVAGLVACGGQGGGAENSAPDKRTAWPDAKQTETLLKQGAQLNAAELQAAAGQAAETGSRFARWPAATSGTGEVLGSKSLVRASKAPLAGHPGGRKLTAKALASVPVYRFFNTQTTAHFYTISEAERDTVRNTLPQFSYEGPAFSVSAAAQPGLSPVYRFFNTQTGVHFYSISEDEKNHIQQTLPQFTFEGVAYYASKTAAEGFTELGRFYVPAKGFHFYTASSMEAVNTDVFHGQTYDWEGFAYYVIGEDYSFSRSMLNELNAVRAQGGFGAMVHNSPLEEAAYAHSDYMLFNYHDGSSWDYQRMSSIDPVTGYLTAHTEAAGMPYFTGVAPIDRASAAGFVSSYVAEVIVNGSVNHQLGTYGGCVKELLNTVFHRDGLLGYDLREFGAAVAYSYFRNDYVCIIEPARSSGTPVTPPAGWVAVYPVAEQTGLPTSFSNEAPDPLPSSPVKGSPVTLYVAPTHELVVTSFELRNASGALVPAKVLTDADFPGYLGSDVAHLVPLSPLQANTRYTAHFVGTNAGVPLTRTWSFSTK